MDDDFFRREYDAGPQKRDNLFLWTIFILLLTGAVLACWIGSYYIFGHPENPKSYRFLVKLHKLDPPKRFEYTAAPPGEFLTPQKLYEKYATMPDAELQQENAGLLRNYIRNYQMSKNPVPYLIGKFAIINSRELTKNDLFSSGMIALAQGAEYPQVLVEYVYTTDPAGISELKEILTPGLEIKLEKTVDLSAILHIEKLDDGRLLLTAMPLLYGTYTLKEGNGTFSLDPPPGLHLEGGVPITKLATIPSAGKNYAVRPASTPGEGTDVATDSPAPTPANPQLIRVMPPAPLNTPSVSTRGTPGRTPTVAVATPPPHPVPIPIPSATPIALATPPRVPAVVAPAPTPVTFAQNVTPAPFVPISPAVSPTPSMPVATPMSGTQGVVLQPFLEAQATPGAAGVAGTWKTYQPGKMPRGRLLKVSDAQGLADHGTGGEQLYLSGQFIVTASSENHAVLRAKGGVLSALNPLDHSSNSVRVYVEFPAGVRTPDEGSTITRDEMRPFEIMEAHRDRDGTVNVTVREITTAQ